MTPIHTPHHFSRRKARQNGIAIVFVLIMLSIATAVAIISARTTLLGERISRNDRDRQIAFQSAELALNDAELDIMDPMTARGCKFGTPQIAADEGCSANADSRGFCGPKASLGNTPMYKAVDWTDTTASRAYVNYGEFTDRADSLQTGTFGAPALKPKYIIVQSALPAVVPYDGGKRQFETRNAYRVYAIGYGASKETQVMLEGVFVKPLLSNRCATGALG
ncbi:MAG: PilX N-terminal domain-containing pilus assembly protein [Ramlibacter sp.]